MKSVRKLSKITLATLTAFSVVGGAVSAQELVLEEIVVTARKVEESVQDISLSISAFTADEISRRSIQELEDIALATPGLTFEDYSNGGFGTPTIRGASQIVLTQLEQNVSTYLDGVYIPRQYAVDVGTTDLERIEVVKGPQSALYGANAFLGAINYVSKSADLEEFSADIGATIGDDDRQDFSAAVSVPLIPEKLAVRVAAAVSEYDGDFVNDFVSTAVVSPGTTGNIGGWDNESYEIDIVAQPTERLSFDFGYKKYDVLSETKAQTRVSTAGNDLNCGGLLFGFLPNTFCGELPSTPIAAFTGEPTGFLIDPRSFGIDSETDFLTAGGTYEINDALSVTYQYGSIEGEVISAGQFDRDLSLGTTLPFLPFPVNAFSQTPIGDFDYDSHEIRLEYAADSGITGLLGFFTSDGVDFDGSSNTIAIPGTPIVALDEPGPGGSDITTTTDIDAIFGRISIPLSEKLVLGLEARYTDETKELVNAGVQSPTFEDDYTTSRISLDYSVSDDSLLYFSVAEGVKSGGQNASSTTLLEADELTYGSDENTSIEIGSKNTFLNGALQLNAAIYHIDWSDLQIQTLPRNATNPLALGILTNLGSAESTGAELDVAYVLNENWSFNGSLAVNDATYDDGTISQRIVRLGLCADGSCPIDGNLGGNSLPRTSDTQWSIGAMYEGIIGGNTDYFIRADYSGQDEQYVSELNTAIIPSREILNLRAGISRESWSAELWVKNATDEEYVSNALYIPLGFQVDYVTSFGNLRRIGLDLKYSF